MKSKPQENDIIWAGIITYMPDMSQLGQLIHSLEDQVEHIIIYNNGGCMADDIIALSKSNKVEVIGEGLNNGIALALNEICIKSLMHHADYLVTFDQDSSPDHSFIKDLYQNIKELDQTTLAVGPAFYDDRGAAREVFPVFQQSRFWVKKVYPAKSEGNIIPADILITSGMMIRLSLWNKVGRFRDDYFIDHVDTEWCLRARYRNLKLYVCNNVAMKHELSNDEPKRIAGRLVLKYSPIRRYYAFRNTVALIKEGTTPFGFKLYYILTLIYRLFVNIVVDEKKNKSFKYMLLGVYHGLAGKMGEKQ